MKKQPAMPTLCRTLGLVLGTACAASAAQTADPDRTILPIPEPARQPSNVVDVRNATPPERFNVTAPQGAPNVLLVLIDDLGFAGTSTFG